LFPVLETRVLTIELLAYLKTKNPPTCGG